MMTFKHIDKKGRGLFQATDNNLVAGEMTYTWAGPDKFIIDHTEVNPEFSGKGVGKQLLMQVVEFAREKKLKVIPLCPFAKSMFEKLPEIGDVLA